ncbi:MAG: hypothetical protein Q9216_005658 [Gyalolechia sp. 2 TL-2023]
MPELSPEQLEFFQRHASDNKQPNLIATIILCLFLASLGVFLRFLARWRNKASFMADDWLILAALIPLAGMTTTTGLTVRYGEGKHIIFVTNAAGFSKIRYALADENGTASDGAIWSQVEISVGIISACLPVYRPLLKQSKRRKPLAADYSIYARSGESESRSRSIPLNKISSTTMTWSSSTNADGHYTEIVDPSSHAQKNHGSLEH